MNAINGRSIVADMVLASMAMQAWQLRLKEMGIDLWVQLVDPNYIHISCAHNNTIWPALYKVGIYKWAEIMGDSATEREEWITQQVTPLETKKDDFDDLEQVWDKAMSVMKRGVSVHARTLPCYDITSDGGHTKGETTMGVYVGDRFKDSVQVIRGGSSFVGE
jgi:hypothetical protein